MSSKVVNSLSIFTIILMVSLLSAYTYFRIAKDTTFRVAETLTPELSRYIDSRIDSTPIVKGIQVVRVNLKKNVRYIIHAYQDDKNLKELYNTFMSDKITLEVPVFTDDFKQNTRVIKLMNHQFDCVPYIETLSYKFVPESGKYVTTVCSISIPPAYGDFKGLIAITLNKEPSKDELNRIEGLLIDLSSKVYAEISAAK